MLTVLALRVGPTASQPGRHRTGRWLAAVAAIVGCAWAWNLSATAGERRLPQSELKDGVRVHEAFRDVVTRMNASTVGVLVGGRQIALGLIVSPDGYILTKASDLAEDLQCHIR
ncbi:MAG TPA: hypothetical protein VFG04_01120, partial [Planctomycetaceae bacterium]|nr:hypothetical protein [Planctomycetaceae bacterium]